jgi:hypothetical protein
MWNWKSPVIVLYMVSFLFGPGLSRSFPQDTHRGGDDQYSVRPPDLYLGSGSPLEVEGMMMKIRMGPRLPTAPVASAIFRRKKSYMNGWGGKCTF